MSKCRNGVERSHRSGIRSKAHALQILASDPHAGKHVKRGTKRLLMEASKILAERKAAADAQNTQIRLARQQRNERRASARLQSQATLVA